MSTKIYLLVFLVLAACGSGGGATAPSYARGIPDNCDWTDSIAGKYTCFNHDTVSYYTPSDTTLTVCLNICDTIPRK
jgi:hypothetical protein